MGAVGLCTPDAPVSTGNVSNSTSTVINSSLPSGVSNTTGTGDASVMSGTVALGIIIAIFASTSSNLGVNFEKHAFNTEQKAAKLEKRKERAYTSLWRWWLGIALIVLGGIGDFACYGLAPQTIVTPMGSLALVSNVFFAHFWLGEAVNKLDLVGTFLILIGAILAVAFGDHDEQCFTLAQLLELYHNPSVIGNFVFVILFLGAFYALSKVCEKTLEEEGEESERYQKLKHLHPLCYPALGGVWGGQTCLFAKSTAEVLKMTFQGNNQLVYFETWAILCAMISTIVLETHFLATGLKYFDALYIVPTFQCFFLASSVIGGAIFFQELANFSALQWIFFPSGVILCMIGVFLLSQRQMGGDTFDDESTEDLLNNDTTGSNKNLYKENLLPHDHNDLSDAGGDNLTMEEGKPTVESDDGNGDTGAVLNNAEVDLNVTTQSDVENSNTAAATTSETNKDKTNFKKTDSKTELIQAAEPVTSAKDFQPMTPVRKDEQKKKAFDDANYADDMEDGPPAGVDPDLSVISPVGPGSTTGGPGEFMQQTTPPPTRTPQLKVTESAPTPVTSAQRRRQHRRSIFEPKLRKEWRGTPEQRRRSMIINNNNASMKLNHRTNLDSSSHILNESETQSVADLESGGESGSNSNQGSNNDTTTMFTSNDLSSSSSSLTSQTSTVKTSRPGRMTTGSFLDFNSNASSSQANHRRKRSVSEDPQSTSIHTNRRKSWGLGDLITISASTSIGSNGESSSQNQTTTRRTSVWKEPFENDGSGADAAGGRARHRTSVLFLPFMLRAGANVDQEFRSGGAGNTGAALTKIRVDDDNAIADEKTKNNVETDDTLTEMKNDLEQGTGEESGKKTDTGTTTDEKNAEVENNDKVETKKEE